MSKVGDFSISGRAFEGMPNLRFLKIIHGSRLQLISEDMEYLPRLRLLDWWYYPRKRLPPNFQPECLVELRMVCSHLQKLWDGIQVGILLSIKNLKSTSKYGFSFSSYFLCLTHAAPSKSQDDISGSF